MHWNTVAPPQLRYFANFINASMRKLRSRSYQHTSTTTYQFSHLPDVDFLCNWIDWSFSQGHVEHCSCLIKGRVGSDWCNLKISKNSNNIFTQFHIFDASTTDRSYSYNQVELTMTGFLMPFSSFAQSLQALQAKTIDSVPPVVIHPQDVVGSPLKREQHIRTISASIFRIPGKVSGCNGLDQADIPQTFVIKSVKISFPNY